MERWECGVGTSSPLNLVVQEAVQTQGKNIPDARRNRQRGGPAVGG